jgi:glycerol-3-phosphate O-acyltransferase
MNVKKMVLFLKRFHASIAQRVRAFFNDTHDHHACFLPDHPGYIISFFLNFFYAGIEVNKHQTFQLRQMQEEGIIVYANKYKSYFEFLFYYSRYKKLGLPFPQIGFDYKVYSLQPVFRLLKIVLAQTHHLLTRFSRCNPYQSGYFKKELLQDKRAAFLSLTGDNTFYHQFVKSRTDPIRFLIEMQKTIDRPIFIVPQLMLFNIRPQRSIPSLLDLIMGFREYPGLIRRLNILFNNKKKIFIEISKPVNILKFLEFKEIQDMDSEQQALLLRRQLFSQMNRHRRSITGPVLKTTEELTESILTDSELRHFMTRYAKRTKTSVQQIRKKAAGYLNEIAANYNPDLIHIYKMGLKWILNTIFEGITIDQEGLEKVRLAAQRAPLILIPCHKSHLDYLILSYVFHNHHMPCPHIAAGKNLSFWPLGPIFRSGGAFFIRRTFKGAILYSKVFAAYVEKLLSEGFNIEFFIEGGRSRSGKILMPKLGMLSLLINGCKKGACDDLIFVPIFIGYDRVIEENSYLHEIRGGKKKPESLLEVLKARKFLKTRYGKVYIKFAEPISLNDHLAKDHQKLGDLSSKEQNLLCNEIGYRVIHAINKHTVVTPYGIVAAAALACPSRNFTYEQFQFHIDTYMNYLSNRKITMADTLLINPAHAFDQTLEKFIQQKMVEKHTLQKKNLMSESTFNVIENRRTMLEYYKNNCIFHFVPPIYTALAILKNDAFQFSSADILNHYRFLQDLFSYEFAADWDREPDYFVRKTIKFFIDEAALVPHHTLPDTYNLTSSGFRKLKAFAGLLKPQFESYWIVLTFFSHFPRDSQESRDRIKKIQALGFKMYKNHEMECFEALSKINYENAASFFNSMGIKGTEDIDLIERYALEIQSYLRHL